MYIYTTPLAANNYTGLDVKNESHPVHVEIVKEKTAIYMYTYTQTYGIMVKIQP